MEGDEQEGQEEGQESTDPAAVEMAEDGALGRLFTEASTGFTPLNTEAGEEPDNPEEPETSEEPEETPPVEDPRIGEHSSQLQALRDQLTELRTQNDILRYQQQQQPQQQPPTPQEYGIADFQADLAKGDPASAIFKLVQEKLKSAKPDINVYEITNRARSEAVSLMQQQKAYESDQASTIAQFGPLFQSNSEFSNLAENIYSRMINGPGSIEIAPGKRWAAGAMQAAASIAYAQLHQAGKLNVAPKVVRMAERKKAPANQLIGDTRADKPRTIASDIPTEDLAVMKRTAAKMGIKFDRYLEIFADMRKKDASYGK